MTEERKLIVRFIYLVIGLLTLSIAACTTQQTIQVVIPSPPETKVEEVTDDLHGVEIVDPYRWLEDQESEETRAWIDEQNVYTDSIMAQLPGRAALREKFSELMRVDEIGAPIERGGRYFYGKRSADQDLYVYYVREGPKGEERILLDPHPLSEDHSTSIQLRGVSSDGSMVVYSLRRGGRDELEVRFMNVDTGEELSDRLEEARYFGFALKEDNSGYYYVRMDEAGPRLYYREMGSPPESERLVFGQGIGFGKFLSANLSPDGRWLLIYLSHGRVRTDLFFVDITSDGEIIPVVEGVDARFTGQFAGGKLYITTNWNAPNGRLMVADPTNPSLENWSEFIPERSDAVLRLVSAVGGRFFALYLENVKSRVVIFDQQGRETGELEFDSICTVSYVTGRWDSDEAFYSFVSFHIPPTIYRFSVSTGEKELWSRIEAPFESDKSEVKQVWFESGDGTSIPMFIVHSRDLKLDGDNPTYLTGYGGFGASLTPDFSPMAAAWIESGGVYAVANLRGGGEFGEEWHRAGMLEKKQNVFDDFIAAAEYLVAEGYTRPERMAIQGHSNGGLLVSAVMTQRPDLFCVVICSYPLIDMLRYQKFLMGSSWVAEYGSADNPEQLKYILEYSPYQNVKQGMRYPAILFITGDGDTRVAPLHARKMAALVQASTSSGKPVLLRYHTKAGHSGGQPLSERIEENAEITAFILWQLGVVQN